MLTATSRSGLTSIDDVAQRLATINDVFLPLVTPAARSHSSTQ